MNDLSVVMSVYKKDCPKKFLVAVESILNQSYCADEVIICVDGPVTNKLEAVINDLENLDTVKIIRLKDNIGLGGSRHIAILETKTTFVAVMDSDDISEYDRFELQMNKHKSSNLDVVGGFIREFKSDDDLHNNKGAIRKTPLRHFEIYTKGKYRSPINHVTVMFRRSAYIKSGGYHSIRDVEDYDLFFRMLIEGYKFANIPNILVNVRFGPKDIYRRRGLSYLKNYINLLLKMLNKNYLNFIEFLFLSIIHSILRLSPIFVLKIVYKFLRN